MDSHSNTNNKVMTVSFMLSAVILGIVVSVLLETLAAVATGAVGRISALELVRHGVPVVAGFILFFVLQFNSSVKSWGDEVVTEIRRVVWPSRKDTFSMTFVVCIMLIISGIAFGILDIVSGSIIDWLLHKNFLGIFS